MDATLKYVITWEDGKLEEMYLTPTQAHNLKNTKPVKSVVFD
jgi:hypothetical protein